MAVAPGMAVAPRSVVAIVGPTATGKTALSLALAHQLNGEVVNADSMQLYRGLDIGTAKLRSSEREGVPHHLFDLWDVTEPASVAEYQRAARAAVDDIRSRGRTPLLVGGSGLYVRAVLEHFDFPGTDAAVRARLENELAAVGAASMHDRLASQDPAAAARILPGDGRRIVRALEVRELTGAAFVAELPEPRPWYPTVYIGVDQETAMLDDRIALRVRRIVGRGAGGGGPVPGAARAAGRAYGRPSAGLPAGAVLPRRLHRRGRGAGGDRTGDPAFCPPAAVVVPPRSPDHLARRGGPGTRQRCPGPGGMMGAWCRAQILSRVMRPATTSSCCPIRTVRSN